MENINRKIMKESQDGTRQICYLVITHGGLVDYSAYAFTSSVFKTNVTVDGGLFLNMTDELKKEMQTNLIQKYYQFPGYCAITGFTIQQDSE
jgi:hypothetical protein